MKRLIIGARGSDYGMWISKPGKDAGSTDDSDMMVSPSRFLLQPYLQGRLYNNGNGSSVTVKHNLGYIPVIELFGPGTLPVGQVTTTALDYSRFAFSQFYVLDVTYFIFRAQLAPN